MKVTLAVAVPALSFLVLNDTVQGLYGPSRDVPLSYVVVEEEPVLEEVEEPAQEESAIVEPEAVEDDVAVVDDATSEEAVADEGVADEAASEDAAAVEEAPVDDAPAAVEEATEDAAATMVALLSPGEMEVGEAAARACASCHQFERQRNAAGPHLVGVNGRVIGSVDGFRYSSALQDLNAEGLVWDMDTLQVWLENPDAFAEGTRMMYNVQDPEERRLIAGWLTQREN